ncbi:hypothetical protein MPER_12290 [Moniliophthora perniciosa FA553]|nr:hypothetical protein MPER_12290 [Moniliophthora perniciosa FA553]
MSCIFPPDYIGFIYWELIRHHADVFFTSDAIWSLRFQEIGMSGFRVQQVSAAASRGGKSRHGSRNLHPDAFWSLWFQEIGMSRIFMRYWSLQLESQDAGAHLNTTDESACGQQWSFGRVILQTDGLNVPPPCPKLIQAPILNTLLSSLWVLRRKAVSSDHNQRCIGYIMQSRASISLLSFLLLLFTQLASALPNPAARQLEARGWDYGDKSDVDHYGDRYGDKELVHHNEWDYGHGNNEHYGDESDHYEHSAWDVLLRAQFDIFVEIDAIKSYQQLTYDDCSKHVTIIRKHITTIYETIQVKSEAGVSWDDIFDRHDSEEIRAQIVIIINTAQLLL